MPSTALVTGSSTGIGYYETARALLADGWRVYATARDRDQDGLEGPGRPRGRDRSDGPDRSRGHRARRRSRVRDEDGGVDCLVNNAGYGQFGPIEDVPTSLLERQFAVHCFGPHRLIRAVLPGMREQGRGRIVNVTSAADRLALAGIGATPPPRSGRSRASATRSDRSWSVRMSKSSSSNPVSSRRRFTTAPCRRSTTRLRPRGHRRAPTPTRRRPRPRLNAGTSTSSDPRSTPTSTASSGEFAPSRAAVH